MTNPTYKNVHKNFKLNGHSLSKEDLWSIAYGFIKEGEEFERPLGDFLLDWIDNKLYVEMKTSGSTGIPKIIRVDKQAMVNSAIATGNFFDLHPGNKALQCLPVQYVAGKMMVIRAIILGLELDYVEPSSHPMKNLNNQEYDFVAMVPKQAQNSLNELKNVKKLIIGGVRMNKSLEEKLMQLSTSVYETYGMTETITHIAAKKVGEKVFTVLPSVKISKDDRNCLVIDAPHIIASGTVITNDLVELVNENQFIFLGRIDNAINSGGIKIMPEQVEHKLDGTIDRRFFISSKEDQELGEKVILVIEGDSFDVDKSLFDVLDKYERPKEIIFVSKFAETENGKVLRNKSLN